MGVDMTRALMMGRNRGGGGAGWRSRDGLNGDKRVISSCDGIWGAALHDHPKTRQHTGTSRASG